jgi:carboxylesterase
VNHEILPTAEPFLLQGNRTGILLIHGFTGTPKEMRWMGEYLNGRGYSCMGIRLAGHATHPEDLRRSRWGDWVASVEDGYQLLRGITDHVYLVGLSMGGMLALLMSTRLEVKGVVAMSAPCRLPGDLPLWRLRLYSWFIRYSPKSREAPGASWFDKAAYAEQVSYPQNPLRSVVELKLLSNAMRAALPEIRKPVLLIHSRDDPYVSPENLEHIDARLVNASDKTRLYITGSGHVVTRDAARHQVFESVGEFIGRIEQT